MRIALKLSLVLSLFIVVSAHVFAESKSKFTKENIYKHFEENYTAKGLFILAQKQAIWLSKMCEKGQDTTQCINGLKEFNSEQTIWENLDGYHACVIIHNFDRNEPIAYPNRILHKALLNKPGLGKVIKDHSGSYYLLFGRSRYLDATSKPKYAWFFQYSTWQMFVTKLKTPLFILEVAVEVPGTNYQVVSQIPYKCSSAGEMLKIIDDLQQRSKKWILTEWD